MFVQITQNIFPPTPDSEATLSQTFAQRLQKLFPRDRSPFDRTDHSTQVRQNRRTCERLLRQHHAFQFQRPRLGWRNVICQPKVIGQHAARRTLVKHFAWNIRREAAMQSKLRSRSWLHWRYGWELFAKWWLLLRRRRLLRRLFLQFEWTSQRIAFFLAFFAFRSSTISSAAGVALLPAMVFTASKRATQIVATSIAPKSEKPNLAITAACHAIVQFRMSFQDGC